VPLGEVIVRRFQGTRFDCGSKAGFLAANIALGRRQGLVG
jgi:UTP-glucose-1-phosphate uridylyltransferase